MGEGVRERAILGVTESHLTSQETRLATYVYKRNIEARSRNHSLPW